MCGNEWSSYLIFSNTHWCSFPNGSVWLEVAESVTGRVALLQLLPIHDGADGMRNLDVMILCLWSIYVNAGSVRLQISHERIWFILLYMTALK